MKRFFARTICLLFAMQSVVMADDKPGAVDNVYNWGDYVDPDLKQQFEDKSGSEVVYDVFDTNETLEDKLRSGNTGNYAVVRPISFQPVIFRQVCTVFSTRATFQI